MDSLDKLASLTGYPLKDRQSLYQLYDHIELNKDLHQFRRIIYDLLQDPSDPSVPVTGDSKNIMDTEQRNSKIALVQRAQDGNFYFSNSAAPITDPSVSKIKLVPQAAIDPAQVTLDTAGFQSTTSDNIHPVKFLDYGVFGSFAPQINSYNATVSATESCLSSFKRPAVPAEPPVDESYLSLLEYNARLIQKLIEFQNNGFEFGTRFVCEEELQTAQQLAFCLEILVEHNPPSYAAEQIHQAMRFVKMYDGGFYGTLPEKKQQSISSNNLGVGSIQ